MILPDTLPATKTAASRPRSSLTHSLESSPLFTHWKDPQSGVQSFLLSKRVAPLQQTFYFVNTSFSNDGRYYWFYCAYPPAGSANQGRSLAVIDFHENRVHHYPESVFTDASPAVDPATGEVYWCAGLEIWKRRPEPDATPVLVNRFPSELARNRRPWRLATHMTFSADHQALNLDVEIGNEWYIGHAPLNGGEFVLWQKFDHCYNHAQFSPVDANLQLIAEDHSVNPLTGDIIHYENRLWVIRHGEQARPLFPKPLSAHAHLRGGNPHYVGDTPHQVTDERSMHGHEWWGRDGRHVWYVHYHRGIERLRLGESEPELVWPHHSLSHAHADAAEKYLVADCIPDEDPSMRQVLFRNLTTGREVNIVSRLPLLPPGLTRYHVHPHPQFCLQDRLIAYTTLVRGVVDVAFVPVESLLAQTA